MPPISAARSRSTGDGGTPAQAARKTAATGNVVLTKQAIWTMLSFLFMRILAAAALVMLLTNVRAQDRSQARSMVISDRGIVATSQTLASQAGAQVLARGGSAIDAAIAANAVQGVVEPESCGMGGDLFAIYWDVKTGKLTGINASGWAPT